MRRSTLLLAILAAGCASSAPAPISYGSRAPGSRPAVAVGAPPQATAGAAETGTLADYALRPQDAQPFDPARLPRTHRVAAGESIHDIATRYQIPLPALVEQNRLEPPYELSPGRVIQLPPPRVHVVRRGETLRDIASAYDIDMRSLALLNRMAPPYDVTPGDRLVLPAIARDAAGDAPSLASEPPVIASGRVNWPLRGSIVVGFGVQADGVRSDGVEITGDEGATIVAAADGEVVYAGEDLPAYGVLVLVRHADDTVTTYGYLRRALVRERQQVRAGEAIAELGPGPGGGARLLFQVRRAGQPIDPAPLLTGGGQ